MNMSPNALTNRLLTDGWPDDDVTTVVSQLGDLTSAAGFGGSDYDTAVAQLAASATWALTVDIEYDLRAAGNKTWTRLNELADPDADVDVTFPAVVDGVTIVDDDDAAWRLQEWVDTCEEVWRAEAEEQGHATYRFTPGSEADENAVRRNRRQAEAMGVGPDVKPPWIEAWQSVWDRVTLPPLRRA